MRKELFEVINEYQKNRQKHAKEYWRKPKNITLRWFSPQKEKIYAQH